jgi:HAD superfamily hydrolase (TIGR01509 family)
VLVLPVSSDLPVERRDVTRRLDGIAAVTFDFGNTLVPVGRAALHRVVELLAGQVAVRFPEIGRGTFLSLWAEERERQFREEVPQFREVDLAERLVRVFARLRGMDPPPPGDRWRQAAAAELSDPSDIAWAVEVYSRAFVDGLPERPGATALLARLASDRDLAIVSNWPLAATIDRYAEAHGWLPHLRSIVVSQRVGTIKPHPAIFAAARTALGNPPPTSILHVGDDWAADVVGAAAVGWRTAWLTDRPDDSPLPTSERGSATEPDIELASLDDLEEALGVPPTQPIPRSPGVEALTG